MIDGKDGCCIGDNVFNVRDVVCTIGDVVVDKAVWDKVCTVGDVAVDDGGNVGFTVCMVDAVVDFINLMQTIVNFVLPLRHNLTLYRAKT